LSRTPLFSSLRRAMRIAALSARRGPATPPIDELLDAGASRRRFLRDTAIVGAAVATSGMLGGCRPSGGPPKIVIVGGGMAGLNAAYKLQKAGLASTVYEGSNRTGGRMFTATDLLGAGLTTELGGEFIDTSHAEMLALIDEFGLQRLDTLDPSVESLKKETYFVNGRHYTIAQAARAFVPLAARVAADYESMDDVDFDTEGGGTVFDQMSIAQYLDGYGASGWLRELLDVAYVTEYGLDPQEQSSLNFTFLIGTGDLSTPEGFSLLGESDERYKVKGGNQQLVDELARRVGPAINLRHKLEAIRSRGEGFRLTFQSDGGAVDVDADIVVLAIPFSLLREVDIRAPLSPLKQKSIRELAYGNNAKVLVGFETRRWQTLGYSGATYTDEPFQLAWDNSFVQPGTAGGLTLYSGGKAALDVGQGTAEEAARRLMPGVDRAYPGAIGQQNGKVSRFHWPTFPWTKGSYSCYKPGQWTTIGGYEGVPEGNLFFAGEHCSYDFQGYMNGAAQSGADTAVAIMAKLSGSAPATDSVTIARRQLGRRLLAWRTLDSSHFGGA
jgi:monoamine oxidase